MIAIDLLCEPKHLADRQCRVEIVVHRRIKVAQKGLRLSGKLRRSVRCPLTLQEFVDHVIRAFQTRESRLCLLQPLVAEIEWAAVMGLEDEEANHLARIFLQNVLDCEEVILRLRHFLVVDGDKAIVEPIARKFHVSVDAWIRLCDLILMMREDQITAAAVEVKRLTEILYGHRRALDVPARTSLPPWAVPRRLARLCRLPQSKVHRMMLRLVDLDARTCLHVVKTASAEASVRSKCLDAVVDVARLRNIGIAALDQRLDHADDVVHRLGDARKYIGTMHIQRIHRREVGGDIAV